MANASFGSQWTTWVGLHSSFGNCAANSARAAEAWWALWGLNLRRGTNQRPGEYGHGGNPEPRALGAEPVFSVVNLVDGACYVRAAGLNAKTVVIGLFSSELAALAWMGLLDIADRIGG
jgi:hypothetical protein